MVWRRWNHQQRERILRLRQRPGRGRDDDDGAAADDDAGPPPDDDVVVAGSWPSSSRGW